MKSSSNITEISLNYTELSKEVWNDEINVDIDFQNIIVDYIFENVVKSEQTPDLDNNLIDFLRFITKFEPNNIDQRYWFISKKISSLANNYYCDIISKEIDGKCLSDRLNILNEYYNKNMDMCDWYFVQFEEITDKTSEFIINKFILSEKEKILDEIKFLLEQGKWKTFKQIMMTLNKIDEREHLNDEILKWGIEKMINECCQNCLNLEKAKFKDNKFSNICRYLNFFKRINSLLETIGFNYEKELESVYKKDLNYCYDKVLDMESGTEPRSSKITEKESGKFGQDLSEFIFKFLSNYDKSKSKFDFENEQNIETIQKVIGLIDNNDEFQILLQNFLARRFISNDFNERDKIFALAISNIETLDMLSSRIRVMLKDTNSFKNLNDDYRSIYGVGVQSDYKVITNGIWGIKETTFMDEQAGYKINRLPADLKQLTTEFQEFYDMKYERRKLTWNFSHTNLEMDFMINDKVYNIHTTFPISQVLLYFNTYNKLMKIDVIREKISLRNIDLLKSFKIIKEIGDHYVINEEFIADPSQPIILTGVKNTIKRLEPVKTNTDMLEIDDMIKCFLMKIVKQLNGTQIKRDILIQECIDRVKYRVEVDRARVNKGLKKLVEGDYLIVTNEGDIKYS